MEHPTPDRRREARDAIPEYTPLAVPRRPLCVPLPSGWYDDPYYVLRPFATAGCSTPPAQQGVIGRVPSTQAKIAQSYEECFAHGYFAPPDSGKGYLLGCHVENALLQTPYLNALPAPLCAVVIHFGRGRSHEPDLLACHHPNQVPAEVHRLIHQYGSLPQAIKDRVCLTLREQVAAQREALPHWQVHELAQPVSALGVVGLKLLMGFPLRDESLHGQLFEELLRRLPPGFGKEDVSAAIAGLPDKAARTPIRRRWLLAQDFVDDAAPPPRAWVRPGRLIVIDVRDGWLAPRRAMRVLAALLHALVWHEGREGLPCNLLLCFDEAHQFMRHPEMAGQIEALVRERRHLRVSVILCSQDPPSVTREVLAELDGVGIFQMDSQRWLAHLAQEVAAYGGLPIRECAALPPEHMLFWSRRWHEPGGTGTLSGSPLVQVHVRPRLSHHGGATRRATD